MNQFYKLLGISLLTATTNNFVWFALTFWIYLTTKSVVSTSVLAGVWLVFTALSGIWFGSIVDHFKKKTAMIGSSIATLVFFLIGYYVFNSIPIEYFENVNSVTLWIFVLFLMIGVVCGSIYQISVPTLVAVMVPENKRDKANGMFGTVMGVSFAITSVASGLALANLGMSWVMLIAIIATTFALILLFLLNINENSSNSMHKHASAHTVAQAIQEPVHHKKVDIRGTISAIQKVPGLFALIFFTTFNNFLGGVFMSLMDAYGLSLMTVQNWGIMWGFLSFGFIFGGLYISKFGLGKKPLNTLFNVNIILWIDCILFTIQPSVVLLASGMFVWMCLVPFVEATEQTVFQKVVPKERLGRVFGFAHSVEQAASPLTAFLIGPIAQTFFIPFMTTGRGVDMIGEWFGTGVGRGIALVFITAGVLGLLVTLVARKSHSFFVLSKVYSK